VHQLEIKVLNIIDARCNHEVYNDVYFYFSMNTCFVLQRPSSGSHYRTFEIWQNTL